MVGAAVRTDDLSRSSRGSKVPGHRQAPHIGTFLLWSVPHKVAKAACHTWLAVAAETMMSILVDI